MAEDKIKLVIDGKEHHISATELSASNNLLIKSLIAVLVEKGIVTAEEIAKTLQRVEKAQIRHE
jgi:uncharacterized ubiquitin-like protein YukD